MSRNSRTDRARAHRAFTASLRTGKTTRNRAPDDLDLSRSWYLVFTTPRGEAKAAEGLVKAGCKIFLPSEHVIKVTSRRRLEYDRPTYPRYLFASGLPSLARRISQVGADGRSAVTIDGVPITDIREIDGVSDVIRGGDGNWAEVPLAAMAAIAEYQNATPPPPPEPRYRRDQTVRILDGPFMSFMATVMDVLNREEAHVLVDVFGRSARVRVELANIEPI